MSISINAAESGNMHGFDPSQIAAKMASKMMSDLDPNNSGSVTKDKFVSALTAKGLSSADATKMYDSIDTKSTGSITKSDIESAVKSGRLKPPAGGFSGVSRQPPGAGGSHGPGGAGAHGGSGGSKGASQASSSTSSKNYEAADTNQDGTVSQVEAAIYALKHPSDESSLSKLETNVLGKTIDKKV